MSTLRKQTRRALACALVALAIGSQAGARPVESTACSSTSPSGPVNLTGRWAASDSTPYYLRQKGTCLWWIGGKGRTNVFFGSVFGSSVTGVWADVFAGKSGTLTFSISQTGRRLTLRASTPQFVTGVLRKS
jgi:hypothetical protein